MKKLALAVCLALAAGLAGCSNFNYPIGVQQFGSVTGTVVDATTKQPLGGANVNVTCGGQAAHTDPNGGFTINQVAIGTQTCTINAVGYQPWGPTSVTVTANTTTQLGVIPLTPTLQPSGG